ncbi:ArsC/Spx/MgsR family protein [Lactococcus petauri]|uniref:ArsC/Spx/MgsR family protein n=1 Tax=Lactococcus petauri TaxID=1940789 RepID=UPI00254C28AB|nr:ArsC/Spx/MgsR family protein [Lactococcus petauri]
MITIYGKKSCNSTKRALEWFNKYQIDIKLYNVTQITREDLVEILSKSSIGIDGLVKSSSRVCSKNRKKIKKLEEMGFNEGINYLTTYSTLLQTPIIKGDKLSVIGYNSEEIRHFLPKEYRRKSFTKREESIRK